VSESVIGSFTTVEPTWISREEKAARMLPAATAQAGSMAGSPGTADTVAASGRTAGRNTGNVRAASGDRPTLLDSPSSAAYHRRPLLNLATVVSGSIGVLAVPNQSGTGQV